MRCELRTIVLSVLATCAMMEAWARPSAPTGGKGAAEPSSLGSWRFEEGSFFDGFGPASATILDSSGNENHGYRPDPLRRMSYVKDAFSGKWAMEFNNPLDTRPYPGVVVVPHHPTLEPAEGQIEARIKFQKHHRAILITKSTFQFLNSEPGPEPPIFFIDGQPRIVGRTVYHLEITEDGHVIGLIGNDGLAKTRANQGGPWSSVKSEKKLRLGEWNHVAMRWDGCRMFVYVNGEWSFGAEYEPIPELGLSYKAEAVDPTYGPQSLDVALSSTGFPFVGIMDDVRISNGDGCFEPGD